MALPSNTDSTSCTCTSTTEQRWLDDIIKLLEKEQNTSISVPVSIFRVSATLRSAKPEAYTPQVMGLGPYHHFRPDLYEMERFKVAAAIAVKKRCSGLEFKELVEWVELKSEESHSLRACYHKYLDMDGNKLCWIMVIDSLFLLNLLHDFVDQEGGPGGPSSKFWKAAQLLDSAGNGLSFHSVLRDMMMLENQIPIFLLREIGSYLCQHHYSPKGVDCSPKGVDIWLRSELIGFCKAVSPLNFKEDLSSHQVFKHAHLLDLLYHLLVPKKDTNNKVQSNEASSTTTIIQVQDDVPHEDNQVQDEPGIPEFDDKSKTQIFGWLWTVVNMLNVGVVQKILKPMKVCVKPIPQLTVVGSSIRRSFQEEAAAEDGEEDDGKGPQKRVEEITIPSVTLLHDVGVEFCSCDDISTIRFDKKGRKFYLPKVALDVNSDVIIRNLVAYEASIEPDSLVFTCYTDLMTGIVDTAEDAKLLRKKKLVRNRLKSDAEVAQLFNGLSKSVRLTKVAHLDAAIKDVNAYYYSTRKVRMRRCLRRYVYGSWQILTLLAAVVLMLLVAVQSFCSVYSCPRIFKTNTLNLA